MQTGLKLWNINTDFYFEEAKRLYKEKCFDYIELYIIPNKIDTLLKWATLDIPFIIHAPHSAHNFNLADKSLKKSNENIYKEVKQFADKLKAKYIIFHGGCDASIEETAEQLKNLNEERALIENKPYKPLPNKWNYTQCRGYNKEEIEYVMNISDCGFCLDFGHAICAANSLGIDYWNYIDDFLELKPNMLHLSDIKDLTSELDSHEHIGKGMLDMKKILSKISNDALITIETNKNNKENLNDFISDIETFLNIL